MSKCKNGAYLKWWVGIDIREILLGNEDIVELTDSDIYPIVAPEGTLGNIIVYRRIKYQRDYGKMGLMDDVARIEVLAVADSYEESVSLAALIDDTLTGTHTNSENSLKYSLEFSLFDSEEAFEDNKYVQTLIFEVK